MGYLHQAIGIDARYARHRNAWRPHLENSRDFILTSAKSCKRRRKAVLMGAGTLHDLPVQALANLFEEVVLVDLFHLWSTRWLAFNNKNITLKACDLTASLETIYSGDATVHEPVEFLDDDDVDFVVSANIASQLPLIPLDWLNNCFNIDAGKRQQFGEEIISAHFDYLKKFKATACLISDAERITLDESGEEASRQSALFGASPATQQASWEWDIAPYGELNRQQATRHIVIAAILGQNSGT
jgi:hypothetical protein